MIIPFDQLQSIPIYMSEYQHLSTCFYKTCDDNTHPGILEKTTWGNPLDPNGGMKVTYLVYFGNFPEPYSRPIPETADSVEQDPEPAYLEKDMFACYAVFKDIEIAYKYALTINLESL